MTLYQSTSVKNSKSFGSGADGVTASSKQVVITVSGTAEAGDKFNIQLDEKNFGYVGKPIPPVAFLLTLGKKIYGITDTLLQFSAVAAPTVWDTVTGVGAGFINLFNEFTGGERLRALASYAGRMAIFARRTIQVWSMDVDPARNQQMQVLDNIGTLAPRSVTQVGDVDVFFLADSGIRSLRSRDINNVAFSSDVGNAIDELVVADMRELGAAAENAIGVIEPADGRYWLVLGEKIYVFSHFSQSKVAAWSTYEPGFTITHAVVRDGRIWVRDDEGSVYLYGGADNNTYDACPVSGTIPFLSAGGPATMKTFTAFDAVVEGTWSFAIGTNPEEPDTRDPIGTLWAPSFDMQRVPINAAGTHFSVKFTRAEAEYGRLSNMIVHYQSNESG
jgi:hypothetical protein